jgi:4'-phosphopantetheinyl transferase EntD
MTRLPGLDRVRATLATLFPSEVAIAVCEVAAADPGSLWPEESAAITGAVPHRLAEFAAGRAAARAALAALCVAPTALPMGPDRAPVWPDGISGSIAHAAGIAIAVARRGAPLGVDVEEDAPLPPDLWPVITTPAERQSLPEGDTSGLIARVFVAKEALFKAQAPDARAMFGFDAVTLTLAKTGFDAKFLTQAGAFRPGDIIHGRLAVAEGLILAGVAR